MLLKQVSSGSKGNCYIYKNLMLDCGVAFKHIKDLLPSIEIIFISHTHTDHIRASTIKRIAKDHKDIKFTGGAHMVDTFNDLNVDFIPLDEDILYNFGNVKLQLVKMYHDVPNYTCRIIDDLKGIYITDTEHVEGIIAKDYDFIICEHSYPKQYAQEQMDNAGDSFCKYFRTVETHLSHEQCDKFIHENAKEGTEILKVHLGSDFNKEDYDLHYKYKGEIE